MDKLQMTVTLSADSAPDLLAYLRQIPGARERSFMLRMLAQRGLQLVKSNSADVLLWRGDTPGHTQTSAVHPPASERSTVQVPTVAPAVDVPSPPSPLPNLVEPAPAADFAARIDSPPEDMGPLLGIDIAALNDAISRY